MNEVGRVELGRFAVGLVQDVLTLVSKRGRLHVLKELLHVVHRCAVGTVQRELESAHTGWHMLPLGVPEKDNWLADRCCINIG